MVGILRADRMSAFLMYQCASRICRKITFWELSMRLILVLAACAQIAEKGTPFGDPKKKRNFASKWIKEGISFANVVSGEVPNQIPIDDKKKIPPMDSLVKIVTTPQT
ncbi:hypothetical protein TNCV_233871 [Trichonephila clavipes]|nr:hypothetical protein TNCV_233871 [Trichonephila clavipes]